MTPRPKPPLTIPVYSAPDFPTLSHVENTLADALVWAAWWGRDRCYTMQVGKKIKVFIEAKEKVAARKH
jgi:hypothetical protein